MVGVHRELMDEKVLEIERRLEAFAKQVLQVLGAKRDVIKHSLQTLTELVSSFLVIVCYYFI